MCNLYITLFACALCTTVTMIWKKKSTNNTGGGNLLWMGPCLAVLSSASPRTVIQRMQCSKTASKCAKGGPSCSVEDTSPTAVLCQEHACACLYVAPSVWCFSPAKELPDARSISWNHLGDTCIGIRKALLQCLQILQAWLIKVVIELWKPPSMIKRSCHEPVPSKWE